MLKAEINFWFLLFVSIHVFYVSMNTTVIFDSGGHALRAGCVRRRMRRKK
jgi:hypothetical protein